MKTLTSNILIDTACLSKRQLEEYAARTMPAEECHSVEMHIVTCPYCRAAVKGIDEEQSMITALATLDNSFIYNFTDKSQTSSSGHQKKWRQSAGIRKRINHTLQISAVAASVLLLAGIIWFFENNKPNKEMADPEKITTTTTGSIYAQPVEYQGNSKVNIVR